jgi:NADH:ubiquinone oxidoreductase subunit 5 (subunit L)/multisubunit Na+/H+ antiporter MnhA subunit
LTFRGTERFRTVTQGEDPHESSWMMTLPLVVLAVLAILGGGLDLPWVHNHSLASFLDPTFGAVPAGAPLSVVTQWGLSLVDVAAAIVGLMAAFSIWRDKHESETFEREYGTGMVSTTQPLVDPLPLRREWATWWLNRRSLTAPPMALVGWLLALVYSSVNCRRASFVNTR